MKTYDEGRIPEFLEEYRNIAVVGISDKPERDSYRVSMYLKVHGYNIIPINPKMESWEGLKAYPDLKSVPRELNVDVVDIFRKSDAVYEIVSEALHLNPKLVWMQETVINEDAADLAKSNGISVVMDRCMMKEHNLLGRQ